MYKEKEGKKWVNNVFFFKELLLMLYFIFGFLCIVIFLKKVFEIILYI